MIVYMAINKINGKKYIGATVKGLYVRSFAHKMSAQSGRNNCKKFHNAIAKYGFENFEWKIIGSYNSADEMYEAEKIFIKELNPEYNISSGGKSPIFGLPRTAEWNANISKGLVGRKMSKESIEKSKETIRRNGLRLKKVICLNDRIIHNSFKEAAAFYAIERSSISNICRGKEISIRGLYFRKYKEPLSGQQCDNLIAQDIKRKRENMEKGGFSRRTPIICFNNMTIYKSVKEASEKLGIYYTGISEVLRGLHLHVKGYKFSYLNQELKMMVA